MNDRRIPPSRRTLLKAGALLPTIAMPSLVRAQSGTLKIGVILPLTGVLAFPGQQTRQGTELAVKMMKDQGINVEATFIDTESKAETEDHQPPKAVELRPEDSEVAEVQAELAQVRGDAAMARRVRKVRTPVPRARPGPRR